MAQLVPNIDHLDPNDVGRVLLTTSCTDSDPIPKVDRAGDVVQRDGQAVQIMHNGLLVEEGCYYGPWMTEVIRSLQGHHEPQEELVFAHLLDRLATSDDATNGPTVIEFGSFWSYYSMWFVHRLPGARAVAMEPDPTYLEVGRRNAALNGLADRITFIPGVIGTQPGRTMPFTAESDGQVHSLEQHDLASLMAATDLDHVDLVLADVQGAETALLKRAEADLRAGRVRFLIVSTHHHAISGDPLTHQSALDQLVGWGGHVIAEHTPTESFSGDGLIAVSFDDRDADMAIQLSYARGRDAVFGPLEVAVYEQWRRAEAAELDARTARSELAKADAQRATTEAELTALQVTKLFRWARAPRAVYQRWRARR